MIFFFLSALVRSFARRFNIDKVGISSVDGIFIEFFFFYSFHCLFVFFYLDREREKRIWKKGKRNEWIRARKCSGIQANHSIHSAGSELIQPNVFKWWIICMKYIVLCLCEHLVLIHTGLCGCKSERESTTSIEKSSLHLVRMLMVFVWARARADKMRA